MGGPAPAYHAPMSTQDPSGSQPPPAVPADQAALWNGPAGQAWVDVQPTLDATFAPFEEMLAGIADALAATRVLDVGCGTGSTTLALARPDARRYERRCTGIDLSAPMIARARERARSEGSAATFLCGDAQDHALGAAAFDLIVSRFGVMFFADPPRAFANLRRAMAPGGALRAIAWRSAGHNPFMTTAERAAAPLLPGLPARRPDAPGQFAFADAARVRAILAAGGWDDIDIVPVDRLCSLPVAALPGYYMQLGPVGQALRQVDAGTRARVVAALDAAFLPFVDGDVVRFDAACWLIEASAPAPGP